MTEPKKDDEVLATLFHAGSKQGKTTLAATAPTPHLALDAEGGWKFIRTQGFRSDTVLRKKKWNPLTEVIPRYDGTWDLCVAGVRDWQTMMMVYQHLTQREHDFISVTWDSITEVQRKCRAALKGTEAMQVQDWGVLLVQMDDLIRKFRDLTLDPTNPIKYVTFIAETKMKDGKWRPQMQGQLGDALPYLVDICGWLSTVYTEDAQGQPTVRHPVLSVAPSDFYEAGERVQGMLPPSILDPDLRTIISTIYPA